MIKKLTQFLSKYQITLDQFNVLYNIEDKEELKDVVSTFINPYELLQNLHRRGFIKFMSGDMDNYARVDYIVLGSKGHDLMDDYYDEFNEFDEEIARENPNVAEDWIEQYRDIFAPAKASGGRPIKGGKASCYKKMERFLREHPDVTPEQILQAATNYMIRKSKDNYAFVTCADYFIYKRDKSGGEVSLLETEVEQVKEGNIETHGDGFTVKL